MTTKIVFFGTPEFAVPSLSALAAKGFRNIIVVTQPDKPAGRGLMTEAPAIKVKAQELGLKVLQPKTLKAEETMAELKSLRVKVAVVVAYGKIIPQAILDLFPRGVLNLHPSLLPKYRGPSPIQSAILNGDAETGVTVMRLDSELDHGPILLRRTGRLAPLTRGSDLSKALADDGAKLLVDTLPKYLAGEIVPHPQDHARATFTQLLEREDGQIDWQKPAQYIERMIRAYDLWPGTWAQWKDARIKILRASLLHPNVGCANNHKPGYIWKTEDDRLAVNCHPGSIVLEQLQMAGKKSMRASDFLRGYPKFVGAVLR